MGLYDRYQSQNSSTIPTFQGSSGPEAIKVGQYLQGLYDTGQAGWMKLMGDKEQLTSLKQDEGLKNELYSSVTGELDKMSKEGNFEDMIPRVQLLGSNFASRYRELMAPIQQRQEYETKMLEDKDRNLTPWQKQLLLAKSDHEYKGLQKDAQGRYVGGYRGTMPDKNIDVNAKVDKWMDGIAVAEGGSKMTNDNGIWKTWTGKTWKQLEPQKIENALRLAMANDQEYQGYRKMMGDLSGFSAGQRITDPNQISDPAFRKAVEDTAAKYGVPINEAAGIVVGSQTQKDIENYALSYAKTKYAVNNLFTDNGNELGDVEKEARKKALTDESPYIVAGPNVQTTDDEANITKLNENFGTVTTNLKEVNKEIVRLNTQLKRTDLKPDERSQMQTQVHNLKEQQRGLVEKTDRINQVIDYSKAKTVQSMGYTTFEDFKKAQMTKVLDVVNNGTKDKQVTFGKNDSFKLTKEQVAEAIVDGRIKLANTGRPYYIDHDGTEHKMGDKYMVMVTNAITQSDVQKFNNNWARDHKNNVKDYSVSTQVINLPKSEQDAVTSALKGGVNGVSFRTPGSYGDGDEKERPANFKVYGIRNISPNGEVTLIVRELDEDNKETGKEYEAVAKNSNIAGELARKFAKQGQTNRQAQVISQILTPGSGASQLFNKPIGFGMSIGTVGGKALSVKVIKTEGGKIYYGLVDPTGTIQSTTDGKQFYTDDIGEAGQWVDQLKTD
jgi:hypothetical protein